MRRTSSERGHVEAGSRRVLVWPSCRYDLCARIKLYPLYAVHVQVAEERIFPAAEGIKRDRHRDRHVDADHADLDLILEARRGAARLGEDRGAVRVRVAVDEGDRLFKGIFS